MARRKRILYNYVIRNIERPDGRQIAIEDFIRTLYPLWRFSSSVKQALDRIEHACEFRNVIPWPDKLKLWEESINNEYINEALFVTYVLKADLLCFSNFKKTCKSVFCVNMMWYYVDWDASGRHGLDQHRTEWIREKFHAFPVWNPDLQIIVTPQNTIV